MSASLHQIIGNIVENVTNQYTNCVLIKDTACGGKQRVPLFIEGDKSRKTNLCNVDLLLIKDKKIRVIFEIEESDITPIRICGKFLSSALTHYYSYGVNTGANKSDMGESVAFIQILSKEKLKKERTSKFDQGENIKKAINSILPIKGSKITEYELLCGNKAEFSAPTGTMRNALIKFLKERICISGSSKLHTARNV